jgi:hypothetical protein
LVVLGGRRRPFDVRFDVSHLGHVVAETVTRELWHRRSGARLPAGPGEGVTRGDGSRETTRRRATPAALDCYRCSEDRRKLIAVRVVAGGITLGTTLLCSECIAALEPLDPDPLHVEGAA